MQQLSSEHFQNFTKQTFITLGTPIVLFLALGWYGCPVSSIPLEKKHREVITKQDQHQEPTKQESTNQESNSIDASENQVNDAPLEKRAEKPPEQLADKPPQAMQCNGAKELCSRRYNEVSYPTTHNAMSSKEDNWGPPNQLKNLGHQLKDGVRGFMLDVHLSAKIAMLCHGPSALFCSIGKRPLKEALQEMKVFMDQHPHEILTIIFENYVSAELLEKAFKGSQILPFVYAHTKGTPWPTLAEMIRQKKRLVVFTDKAGGERPWLLKIWDHAWETDYSAKEPKDLKCKKNRGSTKHPLFILNHFLTNPIAKAELAKKVNFNPFFLKRTLDCQTQSGRLPNFVTVDFYSLGDLFSVVKKLNKLPS